MQTFIKLLSIVFLMLTVACSTTNKNSRSSDNGNSSIVLAKNLPNYIDTLPRLSVQGSGGSMRVVNTSVSTITGDTAPLFVLDDIQIGRDFSQIMRLLDDNQAVSVQYLTTRRATILYGEAGKNGAIILSREQGV